jgi:serine/threonine protein kinase
MDEQANQPRKDPRLGRVLSQQYRLDSAIGEGGMGTVYRGQQLSVGRPVAVKLIAGKIAENPECVKRFRREAEAMAKLHHPNTVRLFDFGVADEGELFMVMELLDGVDLSEHLTRRGRLPPGEALDIARQVLEALSEAHELGIVHRDLKPANVFLAKVPGSRSVVKVMDFGIAGIEQSGAGTKLTMTGAVMGTPAYMSPEQAQGKLVDARSDLYSLGVMLFEMLTGKPPFEADSAVSLLLAQVSAPPPRLLDSSPGISHGVALQTFLDNLLDKSPERRPVSAQATLQRIDQITRQLDPAAAQSLLPVASGAPPALAQNTFSQSTLSGPASPGRGKWYAGAGLATAAALAVVWWPGARPQPLGPPLPVPAPAPAPGPGANVMYSVHIVSKPAGAGVELAGVEIGKTPYTLQFRQPTAITLALPGYLEKGLQVDAQTEPNLVVELEPASVAHNRAGPRRARSEHADVPARPPEAPPVQAQQAAPTSAPPPAAPPSPPVVAATVAPVARPQSAPPVAAPPPPAWLARPAPVMSARDRREAMLRSGPPFRNVISAKQAYRSGQLSEDAYEDVIWVLKTQRASRIQTEKLNYKRGLISRDEYERRVARIDYEYEGR